MFAIEELEDMVNDPEFPQDKKTETEEAIDSFKKFNKFLSDNFGLSESESEKEFNDFLDSKEPEIEKKLAPAVKKAEAFEDEEKGQIFLIKEVSKEVGKVSKEFADSKGYDKFESRELEVSTKKIAELFGDMLTNDFI